MFSSKLTARVSYDSAVLPPVVPAFALRPTTTEQLGICVKKLYDYGIPMTVRGAGTNLSGGTIPDSKESVVILINGLNRILEINSDDLYAVVEPGVVTATFAAEVAKKNLFYPPDPGSQAVSTLAGNIAENAGGLRGLKYGVTKDYLMGLEFFDATGELVKSGSRTVKCVTGYNLAGMMLQSEGTLGIISQAVLKLVPPPQASKALMAVFDDMQKAAEAVAGIIAAHVVPCTLEFLDNNTIVRVDDYTEAGLPRDAAAILLIEVGLRYPAQVADGPRGRTRAAADRCRGRACGQGRRRKVQAVGSPPPGPARAGPLQAHHRARRRHRAALPDPCHDEGRQRHRQEVQCRSGHLRSCR